MNVINGTGDGSYTAGATMTSTRQTSVIPIDSVQRQAAALQLMAQLQPHEFIGVACTVLLQSVYGHPDMLRRVLNESVIKEGFRGEALIRVLTRAAR